MKILALPTASHLYSSNVYLVLGDWKRIEDVNTLVDVGSDPGIVQAINRHDTGIGKKKVDQVILTHGHSDHMAALKAVCEAFRPKVYAFSKFVDGVDEVLKDGDRLRVGEHMCEIIHTPGHSSDSISLYCREEGILFVGDAPVVIRTLNGAYEEDYLEALDKLSRLKIRKIFFGHGKPLTHDAHATILESLSNVRQSILESNRHQTVPPGHHADGKTIFKAKNA